MEFSKEVKKAEHLLSESQTWWGDTETQDNGLVLAVQSVAASLIGIQKTLEAIYAEKT